MNNLSLLFELIKVARLKSDKINRTIYRLYPSVKDFVKKVDFAIFSKNTASFQLATRFRYFRS